jgi:hypothetical protein
MPTEEFTEMFHGTNSEAALAIVRSQWFRPSDSGMLGPGIYVTSEKEKAEVYRNFHPGGQHRHNDPLHNGQPDPGCILTCRVRMGLCKELVKEDPLMQSWHSKYNSAHSGGCPCSPRCRTGMHSCPFANGVRSELCVCNSMSIDRIVIIDGPESLKCDDGTFEGREHWVVSLARYGDVEALRQLGGDSLSLYRHQMVKAACQGGSIQALELLLFPMMVGQGRRLWPVRPNVGTWPS